MTASLSDALVLFGVTGDLAHKMIFPALYSMAERGDLKVPVIGVAFPKWSLAHLSNRVKDSIRRSGGIHNQRALHHLLSLVKYVSGDYNDPGTFRAIKMAMGSARRPAHYLAIPPALFATVIQGLGEADLAGHARVIVEKPCPFGKTARFDLSHVFSEYLCGRLSLQSFQRYARAPCIQFREAQSVSSGYAMTKAHLEERRLLGCWT